MKIEVFLTSQSVSEEDVKERLVIVVDVLRASSTIVTALSNGARSIIPVADMAEAGKIASNLDHTTFLLGGERGAVKIEGYHLGNSPAEYGRETVEERTIILNTTNGTGAITRAKAAKQTVVASFLNAQRVVSHAKSTGLDTTIVCAAWRNRVALEDAMCAGLIVHRLWDAGGSEIISDGARIAHILYLHDRERLVDAVSQCNHARKLNALGFADDVSYCCQIDTHPVLPVFVDGRIILEGQEKTAPEHHKTQ